MLDPRLKIIEIARSWLGAPYRHQGRSRAGCDCIAPVIDIADELGMVYDQYGNYGRLPAGHKLYHYFKSYMIELPQKGYRPADVLLMTWKKEPHHAAVVVTMNDGELGVVHCHSKVGKVVEHRLNDRWIGRIVHAFRFPAVQRYLNIGPVSPIGPIPGPVGPEQGGN